MVANQSRLVGDERLLQGTDPIISHVGHGIEEVWTDRTSPSWRTPMLKRNDIVTAQSLHLIRDHVQNQVISARPRCEVRRSGSLRQKVCRLVADRAVIRPLAIIKT
jgi:hypothetical protein